MNFIEEYNKIRPTYEVFTSRLKLLLESLLDSENINYHLIEARTKDPKSFEEKIRRKSVKYLDPLKEITDLSGLRIILYYQKDVDFVDEIIRDNFKIDEENTIDKRKTLKSNEFGYLSNHYVVKINSKRTNLPEWKQFKLFCAEIQLRTVLQHSWAAISHELEYKNKNDVPDILKRKLYRLAGLFELADEQFGEVKSEQIELTNAIKNKTTLKNEEVFDEINYDTIKNLFVSDNEIISKFVKAGYEAGFVKETESNIDEFLTEFDFSSIVNISIILKIDSITELIELLKVNLPLAKSYYVAQLDMQTKEKGENNVWYTSNAFLVYLFLLSLLDTKSLKSYRQGNWSSDILNRVKKVILEWKNLRKTIDINH